MTSTILATYDHVEDARRVIDDLTEAGFKRGDIGLALYDPDNKYENYVDDGDVSGSEGASFGASFGGVLGAVVGLGAIAIPGIGPIVAAGPLAAALGALTGAAIGATSGAVAGGITASLIDMGVPEDETHYYAESLRRGAALVSVTAHETDRERAVAILQQHKPINIDQRVAQWRSRGWEGFDPMSDPYKAEPLAEGHNHDEVEWDEEDYRRTVRDYPMP
ncbi:MAG: hypothetical protein CL610_29105 [Anaerolineaceae bacterium]|nr:hypothetical protein [Anaerolineaceae bacterium]